jgi:hypothetical protein
VREIVAEKLLLGAYFDEPKRRRRAKEFLWKGLEYAFVFALSVAASVLGYYIIRWWRSRGGGDGGADDGEGGKDNAGAADALVPHAVRASNPDEVTLVKRRSPDLMQPQVSRALREGYEEREWGTVLARIVDARFEGDYSQRTGAAEKLLQKNFGLDLDALLARAPRRTWSFENNRFEPDSRIMTFVRGAMEFLGVRPRRELISGFDIVRIMSRRTRGGIGFRSGDALQIAMLWALKETGISLGGKQSHEASDDFIALADAFRGERYVERSRSVPIGELMNRVNYQLRNGCLFVHEHAMAAHLARYLHDRWEFDGLDSMVDRMLVNGDYIGCAREMESLDLEGVVEGGRELEKEYVVSLQRIVAARLKYLAVMSGMTGGDDPRTLLECARENAIDAFQRAAVTGRALKAYREYIKGVRRDIGAALDVFRTTGSGGAGDDGGEGGRDGGMPGPAGELGGIDEANRAAPIADATAPSWKALQSGLNFMCVRPFLNRPLPIVMR